MRHQSQCFDLEGYLHMNMVRPRWVCPICCKPVFPAELGVDLLMYRIIDALKVGDGSESIHLYPNGEVCVL